MPFDLAPDIVESTRKYPRQRTSLLGKADGARVAMKEF
jgi:hypothetical protein